MSKPRSKDMKLDPGTFGGTPACYVLVDMMNNNVIPVCEKHRILSFINDAIYQFKWLSSILLSQEYPALQGGDELRT